MTVISREIEINVSKEKAWEAISKFGDICHANPGILESYVSSDKKSGVGATRHCALAMMGASVDERIIQWQEGESLSVEACAFHKLPGMKTMIGEFSVRAKGKNAIVRATLTYTMKNAFFDIMNNLMMKQMNTKIWNEQMAGLKKYIETGVRVTSKTPLDLSEVIVL